MYLLFSTSIPNFKLERSQLENPLVIPYDVPYWKQEKLINLITYGFREKAPLLMRVNWCLVEKELETQQRPQKVSSFKLLRNQIIIIEIETEEQLRDYSRKYNRLPVLLTIAVLKNPNIRSSRKWISDLKIMLIESVQKTIFDDKLIEPKLFSDFPFSFVLENFEDPIDCIEFLNRVIKKRALQFEKSKNLAKFDEEFLRSTFCETIINQLKELNPDELKFLYALALTCVPEELSDLISYSREETMRISGELSSKGFVHIYGNLMNPTAPIKKLSELKFFENIGRLLIESTPEKFNSTKEVYSKILKALEPPGCAFPLERTDLLNTSTMGVTPSINISTIKFLIEDKISKAGLDDLVDINDTERLEDICSRVLWKEKEEKKRRVLFSARSFAYLIKQNIEESLKDASKIERDEEYIDILRRLYLENSKLLFIQGKWYFAIEILNKAIEISKDVDEIQGEIKIQLGSIFEVKGEHDKAIKIFNESLKEFYELGNKRGIASSFLNLGNVHLDKGNFEEAARDLKQSLKIYKELKDKSGIASALLQLGNIYMNRSNIDKAVKYFNQSLEIFKELEDRSGIASALLQLGNTYMNRGNIDKAVNYFDHCFKIYKELGDKRGIASTLLRLGNSHEDRENYEEAVKYFSQSLEIFNELEDRSGIASTLLKLGNVHEDKYNHEEAMKYFNQSLEIFNELGDKSGIASAQQNIGTIHYFKGNYEEAAENYSKSLRIYEELGDKSGIAGSLHNLGIINSCYNNYEEAMENFNQSLKLFNELGNKSEIARALRNIGVFYFIQDNYKRAVKYLNQSLEIFKELGDKKEIKDLLHYLEKIHQEDKK